MEEKRLVLDIEEKPKKIRHWLLFATQHFLAMIVACITVPIITGLPIDATIVAAGIGTLFYIAVTKGKSPVFLSSSFAYIAPILSALALGDEIANNNLLAVIIGMGIVGVVYVIVALIVKFVGTAWLDKLLPPIVIGPVIMVIGLGLSVSAIGNLSNTAGSYNIVGIAVGLVAMLVTALVAHYGKGTVKLVPFVVGLGAGYVLAAILTAIGNATDVEILKLINFTPLKEAFSPVTFKSFLHLPDFLFLKNMTEQFDASQIPTIILLFGPVSFVTICEHIGDHKNMSSIVDRDLLKEPGLTRTLIGDGVATSISGILCGAANTTYGENTAVVGVTKIASTAVIGGAALLSVFVGFFTPFTAFVETIPGSIMGGVSLLLYGFIAASGMKMLINEQIDLGINRNIFVVAVILVAGIGGLVLKIGIVEITSTAVAMILGIILNLILNPKKEEKMETYDI